MNFTKEHILFFCSFPPPNTGQTVTTKRFHDALLNYYNIDLINIADQKRFNRKPGNFSLAVSFMLVRRFFELRKTLKKKNYIAVYVVFAPSFFALIRDSITALIIRSSSNAKVIAQLHCGNYGDNYKTGFKKQLFKFLQPRIDKLIFSSQLLQHFPYPQNKTVYLSNMISEEIVFSDDEINKKLNLKANDSRYKIFFISNMIFEKGYNDLFEACKILKDRAITSFTLHIVGGWPSDECKNNFRDAIKFVKMEELIKVHEPVVSRSEIKNLYWEADILVLPTYYPIEAQPLCIIEALNSATPVISTYHASIPDMIQNNENGFLVEIKSPGQIADNIQKLLSRLVWGRMASNARNSYLEKYDRNIIMPQLLDIFKS